MTEQISDGISASNQGITYDSMTGLRDRMCFFHDANEYSGKGEGRHIVLIQLPASALALINRQFGTSVGDQLFREMAAYLNTVDGEYVAYRIANARLVLMGPERSEEQMQELAVRVGKRFRQVWSVRKNDRVEKVPTKALVIHFLLKQEDTENHILDRMNYSVSVFEDKAVDGVLYFGEELNADMQHKAYVLEEIRYAIAHKTFQIYYQPIYDCEEGCFTSAESLIRLNTRDHVFLSPGEFIPMAEKKMLIDGISWIVLEKVCRFLGEHPELPIRTVSVNMTGKQVLDPSFIGRIEENLERYHVDGSRLRIEITERTVTEDFAGVRKVMETLAEKGIHFYLDDFGTGYSNLASMLELPFEVIKFDQSLVRMMNRRGKGEKTIALLADIMHENEYSIVAEGIETALQVKNARERRLDRIQGFYYAKPMPEGELVEFLEKDLPGDKS